MIRDFRIDTVLADLQRWHLAFQSPTTHTCCGNDSEEAVSNCWFLIAATGDGVGPPGLPPGGPRLPGASSRCVAQSRKEPIIHRLSRVLSLRCVRPCF